jgi:hypothetical protein
MKQVYFEVLHKLHLNFMVFKINKVENSLSGDSIIFFMEKI